MLEIDVPALEWYNTKTDEFITFKPQTLQLEHSLVSLSKWESKWCKSFINTDKTREETIDYIRCMTINAKQVDKDIYAYLPGSIIEEINRYIDAPMTATIVKHDTGGGNNEFITSELIYYWMIAFQIPVEFEKWHLRRLLTLIEVCEAKTKKPKKMSQQEIMKNNALLNAQRRAKLGSKG